MKKLYVAIVLTMCLVMTGCAGSEVATEMSNVSTETEVEEVSTEEEIEVLAEVETETEEVETEVTTEEVVTEVKQEEQSVEVAQETPQVQEAPQETPQPEPQAQPQSEPQPQVVAETPYIYFNGQRIDCPPGQMTVIFEGSFSPLSAGYKARCDKYALQWRLGTDDVVNEDILSIALGGYPITVFPEYAYTNDNEDYTEEVNAWDSNNSRDFWGKKDEYSLTENGMDIGERIHYLTATNENPTWNGMSYSYSYCYVYCLGEYNFQGRLMYYETYYYQSRNQFK